MSKETKPPLTDDNFLAFVFGGCVGFFIRQGLSRDEFLTYASKSYDAISKLVNDDNARLKWEKYEDAVENNIKNNISLETPIDIPCGGCGKITCQYCQYEIDKAMGVKR